MPRIKEARIIDICDFYSGNKSITRIGLQTQRGDIPVYAATLNEPLGYTDIPNAQGRTLLVVNDGVHAGKTYMVEAQQFAIGKHVCGLKIKDQFIDKVDLDYIRVIGEPVFVKQAKGNGQKNLPQNVVKSTLIPIPINIDETYDLVAQKKLVEKHKKLFTQKALLEEKREAIASFEIQEVGVYEMSLVPLGTLACFNTKYCGLNKTKLHYVDTKNKKDYPVYSADKNPIGYLKEASEKINHASEMCPVLTLATNGDGSAGRNFVYHTKDFYITSDRIALTPIATDIYLPYILFALKDIKRKYGFDHAHKANRARLENILCSIPIKLDGTYDMDSQVEIASKFEVFENVKNEICKKIDVLLKHEIKI